MSYTQPPSVPLPDPATDARKSSWLRQHPIAAGSAASLLAFVLGVGVGGASGAGTAAELADVQVARDAAVTQAADLESELDVLREESEAAIADAEARADDAEGRVEQALADADAQLSTAEKMASEAESAAAEVEERARQLTELESELATREAAVQVAERSASAQATTTSPAPSTSAAQAPATQAPAPTTVYYKNCTAAREAGAAPVYRNDPGYGSHLDRDNDGVGCE